MACNCATEKQIEEIYKRFGTSRDNTKKYTLYQDVKYYTTKVFGWIFLIEIIPLIIFYLSNEFRKGNNKISLKNFFGLEYVKE